MRFSWRYAATTLAAAALAAGLAIAGIGGTCGNDSPMTCAAPVAIW